MTCTPVSPVAPSITQATCANGVVTVPTIHFANTDGVVYTANPTGPYDGNVDTTVTIIAVVEGGYGWGQIDNGWEKRNAVIATLRVTLHGASCTSTTPVAPSVVEAECVNGAVTAPTLTLATTDDITYSVDKNPPYSAGDQVTVTATLDAAGVAWPANLPPGWTRTSDTTATYAVTFNSVACQLVALGSAGVPTVTQATCANGTVTAPTITLPLVSGVIMTADPPAPYDGSKDTSVTVTAVVLDGFAWGEVSNGWTIVDDETATYDVTLVGTTCDEVRPVAPTVTQSVCANGTVSAPSIEAAITDGINYTIAPSGPYSAGGQATVTATLNPADVRWPSQLPPGWTKTSDTTATYTVTFDDVSCSAVLPDSLLRVPAVCTADGAVIASLVDLPTTPGITYSVAIDPNDATSATVTATVGQGYGWGDPMTEGWTTTGPTTATHSVTLEMVDCVASSPPVPPTAEIEAVPPERMGGDGRRLHQRWFRYRKRLDRKRWRKRSVSCDGGSGSCPPVDPRGLLGRARRCTPCDRSSAALRRHHLIRNSSDCDDEFARACPASRCLMASGTASSG